MSGNIRADDAFVLYPFFLFFLGRTGPLFIFSYTVLSVTFIRDEKVTVLMVKTYLVTKLGLSNEAEVIT